MLSVEGLRHAFGGGRGEGAGGGRVVALDDVTFSLQGGQTLAIFGPNGAGKTTLLKVLAGLIRPDAGRATVAGGRGAIGWIGHQSHLYDHLTVRENLLFWAALYRVPAASRAQRAAEVMRRVGIAQHAERPVWVLSRGLVQRAAIARALIHEPRVLLLDEPFTGLDLAAAAEFRALLSQLRGAGRVVVLATHNVGEGAELATDVAFQRRGRFVYLAPRGGRAPAAIAAPYRRAPGDAREGLVEPAGGAPQPDQPLLGQAARQSGLRGAGGSGGIAAVRLVLQRARGCGVAPARRCDRARDARLRRRGHVIRRTRDQHPLRRAAAGRDSLALPDPAARRGGTGDCGPARRASLERVRGVA